MTGRPVLLPLAIAVYGACGAAAPAPVRFGPGGEVEASVGPTGALAGVVRDVSDGQPIAFASVAAVGPGGAQVLDVSGPDGRFRLRLPPGRYQLTTRFGGLSRIVPEVVVLRDRVTALDVDLDSRSPRAPLMGTAVSTTPDTGEIAGRVVDVDGHRTTPFAGAVVSVISAGHPDAQMAISGDQGGYRLRGLAPGRYDISVYYQLVDRGAIELRRTDVEVQTGQITRLDLELDLRVER